MDLNLTCKRQMFHMFMKTQATAVSFKGMKSVSEFNHYY